MVDGEQRQIGIVKVRGSKSIVVPIGILGKVAQKHVDELIVVRSRKGNRRRRWALMGATARRCRAGSRGRVRRSSSRRGIPRRQIRGKVGFDLLGGSGRRSSIATVLRAEVHEHEYRQNNSTNRKKNDGNDQSLVRALRGGSYGRANVPARRSIRTNRRATRSAKTRIFFQLTRLYSPRSKRGRVQAVHSG